MSTRVMVERFQATDGALFRNAEDADEHDRAVVVRNEIRALLGDPVGDPGSIFANGGYSIPVDPEKYRQAAELFWSSIKPEWRERFYPHLHGIVGRYLDDNGSPYSAVLWLLICVNTDRWRLYGQPYYAIHPDEVPERSAP